MTDEEKILYQYPPKLASSNDIPNTVKQVLENDEFFLLVAKSDDITVTLKVSCKINPTQLMSEIVQKIKTKIKNFRRHLDPCILKICGQEEYIFGDFPLIRFLYIQDRLSRGEVPTCVIKSVSDVYVFTNKTIVEDIMSMPKHVPAKPTNTLRKKGKQRSSWDIEENFQITIQALSKLNVDTNKTVEIGIQAGLFHGGKALCEKQKTFEKIVRESGSAEWHQILKFDIKVQNIPRMARLCMVIYETAKNAKHIRARRLKDSQKEMYINPICWVNTTVYDYKNQLKTGGVTLYTWTYAEDSDSEELLHPLGTVEPNPRTDECASITMTFHNYNADCSLLFPSEGEVIAYAENRLARKDQATISPAEDERSIVSILQPFIHNDRINDISEQEKKEIWERRFDCMRCQPDALPCLLYCVEWNNRDEVAEVTRILNEWPQDNMSVERTLELLDYAYADPNVRRFAVECLKKIKDEDLQLYLLQLVQAIKHESYLYCDLVEFLLQRALNNQRIGHFLFWHLRSV